MNIIKRLKHNRVAFGLMDEELRRVAEKIGRQEFLTRLRGSFIFVDRNFVWDAVMDDGQTFQLRADWQCSHPEKRSGEIGKAHCCWCGAEIKAEPQMGWVEFPVDVSKHGKGITYRFRIADHGWFGLDECIRMVGFGGIKYEAPCDCVYKSDKFYMTPHSACDQHGPYKPVAVRFWQEVGK